MKIILAIFWIVLIGVLEVLFYDPDTSPKDKLLNQGLLLVCFILISLMVLQR